MTTESGTRWRGARRRQATSRGSLVAVPIAVFTLFAGAPVGERACAGGQSNHETGTGNASRSSTGEKPKQKGHGIPADSLLGHMPEGIGIPVGGEAPDLKLRDSNERVVRLADLWSQSPILLIFYRGGWCPYCNFQIRELKEAYPQFAERGVTPVAVSVDRIEEAARTAATYTVPFPVLVDPDLTAHHAFRVTHSVDDPELKRLREFGVDLEAASGQAHHVIAIPSLFLIDRRGVVRWGHVDLDYTVRPSPAQVLSAIDGARLEMGRSHPK